jgi:alpha-D-ribose 1-methylphosphonate 5-triphosphate synthase subunit PhnI
MYVAVKGGEAAIANAHRLLADRRRGDRSVPALRIDQIVEQLALAVDRVMTEGSLYDRELRGAGHQAGARRHDRGDLPAARLSARRCRASVTSEPVDTSQMQVERRVSATYKDLPGGQLLGPTFDYTHRLLDPVLTDSNPRPSPCMPMQSRA